MALFGKKKLSLEEILEGIKSLSDEEKAKAVAAMQGEQKPEPVETEEPVEDASVEAPNGESEEVTNEVEETETAETVEEPATEPVTEEVETEEPTGEPTDGATEERADVVLPEEQSATDEMANDNRDQIIHELTDKVNELSEQIKGLLELKTLMEEYTGKQAENFGYKGKVLGAKKDFKDMSTDELKAHAIKGI